MTFRGKTRNSIVPEEEWMTSEHHHFVVARSRLPRQLRHCLVSPVSCREGTHDTPSRRILTECYSGSPSVPVHCSDATPVRAATLCVMNCGSLSTAQLLVHPCPGIFSGSSRWPKTRADDPAVADDFRGRGLCPLRTTVESGLGKPWVFDPPPVPFEITSMKTTKATAKKHEAETERAYREHIRTWTDKLLLFLRDGTWTKVSAVANWLAPRMPEEFTVHRFLQEGGTLDKPRSHKSGEGHRLILQDILRSLRDRKLLAFRKNEAGEEEVQVTPGEDPRFTIDPEFEHLLPRAPDEVKKLEERLLVEEPLTPLVVWKGKRVLLDGHTRYRFFSLLGRGYPVVERDFPDRQAVVTWLFDTHYGRRSYSPEMKAYVRGKQYLARKQKHGGSRKKTSARSGNLKTADLVAAEYSIGRNTLLRDAAFAVALDKVADVCGDEVRQQVLSRTVRWTRGDVERLVKLEKGVLQKIVEKALEKKKRPKLPSPEREAGPKGKTLVLPLGEARAQVQVLRKVFDGPGLARLHKALGRFLQQGGV